MDLLTAESWTGAELSALIAEVLSPFDETNFEIHGPELRLPSEVVFSLALALHELATNAAKYGALSVASGRVTITWEITNETGIRLDLRWQERGGLSSRSSEVGCPGSRCAALC